MKTKKLMISPIGELFHTDDAASISWSVEHLIEHADEARPTKQWAFVPVEADIIDGRWPVLRPDHRRLMCKALSTHPTRDAAEAEAKRLNKQLFDALAADLDTVEVPEHIAPSDIIIGPVENGTRPRERRCSLQIGDAEIIVHWETVHVGDRHLDTARIKAEIEKHFAQFAGI